MRAVITLSRQQGFTLIELVVVIVLLGIISFGSTQYIVNSAESYMDTARRERQGSAARVTVEKISRELRNALPNSVRTSVANDCIEFVPVLGGSIYTSLPLMTASNGFSSVPFIVDGAPDIGRVAVYPLNTDEIYDLSATSAAASSVSPRVTSSQAGLEGNAEVDVQLDREHQFPLDSPGRRWFMVSDPVSFCLDGERLYRYSDYGFFAIQPLPGGVNLTESVPQRHLLAIGTSGNFVVQAATLQRNALVQLNLDFRERGEGVTINHEVQLRNVP
ncbi:MAG: type II secretion system protein [Halopseudomonas sp.]